MSERIILIAIHETISDESLHIIKRLLERQMEGLEDIWQLEELDGVNFSMETETVYSFDELNEEAQLQAILDHIQFMIDCLPYEEGSDNFRKAIDEAESMLTPWFCRSYILDYCKDEIIEDIKINEYLFDETGHSVKQNIQVV